LNRPSKGSSTQPIGLFDSGLGGLTIALELLRQLPNERIVYFGDTAHLPYGDKSPSVLRGYVGQITDFLLGHSVKAIVIACNTASAVASDIVLDRANGIPVIEVISPTVAAVLAQDHVNRVGIIGTQTTIRSGVYRRAIERTRNAIHVVEKATPLLVPLIEEGWANHPICQTILEAYLDDVIFEGIDSLILGCTHYPLIRSQVDIYYKAKNQSVCVVDSSHPTVSQLKKLLSETSLLTSDFVPDVKNRFYVSDLNPHFARMAEHFSGGSCFEILEFNWQD
jgi:glutamate racemase